MLTVSRRPALGLPGRTCGSAQRGGGDVPAVQIQLGRLPGNGGLDTEVTGLARKEGEVVVAVVGGQDTAPGLGIPQGQFDGERRGAARIAEPGFDHQAAGAMLRAEFASQGGLGQLVQLLELLLVAGVPIEVVGKQPALLVAQLQLGKTGPGSRPVEGKSVRGSVGSSRQGAVAALELAS